MAVGHDPPQRDPAGAAVKSARELVHMVPSLAGGCDNPNYSPAHSIACDALTQLIEIRDADRVSSADCDLGYLLGSVVAKLIQRDGVTTTRENVIGMMDDLTRKLGVPQ